MAANLEIDLVKGFREMQFDDVEDILQIENSIYSNPWTEGIFKDCIRIGYNSWVYTEQGQLLSYGLVAVAVEEAHILNLCVLPDAQGQGHGKRMLYKLIAVAEERQARSIFLEVRKSNEIAKKLYQQEGFNRIGLRKGYYPSACGREDALVFAKELNLDQRFNLK